MGANYILYPKYTENLNASLGANAGYKIIHQMEEKKMMKNTITWPRPTLSAGGKKHKAFYYLDGGLR